MKRSVAARLLASYDSLPSSNRITPMKRRSFHRSGYTPYDSAGGPAAGPARPIILCPAPEAPRRPATARQGGTSGRRSFVELGCMSVRAVEVRREAQMGLATRLLPGDVASAGFPRDCTGLICPSAVSGQLSDIRPTGQNPLRLKSLLW